MATETRQGNRFQEIYQYPSQKAMKKMKATIKPNLNRRSLLVAREEDLIKNLNPKITGWRNYYVKDEWKADVGIGLVYYLYFYEVV